MKMRESTKTVVMWIIIALVFWSHAYAIHTLPNWAITPLIVTAIVIILDSYVILKDIDVPENDKSTMKRFKDTMDKAREKEMEKECDYT